MSGLDPIPEENLAWDYYYRLYYDDDDDEFVPPENQNYKYTTPMAEGGYDPMDSTTEKDPLIPGTGDDDDDDDTDWDNTDLNQIPAQDYQPPDDTDSTHNPFEPDAASTPAGEQIPMVTRTGLPQEQEGPRSEETSFNEGAQSRWAIAEGQKESAWDKIEWDFPNPDKSKIDARYAVAPRSGQGRGGSVIEVRLKGSNNWHRLLTKLAGDTKATLNKSLPSNIKKALGRTTDEQFSATNAALERYQHELAAKQQQLEQAEQQRAAEAQQLRLDLDAMRNRIKDTDDRIRELEDAHGSLDTEAIQRLKDDKRALESDHQSKRQQLSQLQKKAKQADKIRKDIDKLMLDKRGLTERLDELGAKKNALKPLDEVKQNKEELETKIAEDKRVIADENTSPSERAAAEGRVAANEAELERVNAEIEVRERQRPLLERVKEIFRKYGWTLQAVVLAAGITISAVVLATLNGLKAATKAIGNGLKNLGKQAANALPGLIGSIVSFIFKATGQVFSFLGEHAWLLILAVVAFFMERLLKKRRT